MRVLCPRNRRHPGFRSDHLQHVILGEIVPKSLALHRAERVALAVAGPMDVFLTLARPHVHHEQRRRFWCCGFLERGNQKKRRAFAQELKLVSQPAAASACCPRCRRHDPSRPRTRRRHRTRDQWCTARHLLAPSRHAFGRSHGARRRRAHSRIPVYDPSRTEHIIGVLYSKDIARLMHQKLTRARAGGLAVVNSRCVT